MAGMCRGGEKKMNDQAITCELTEGFNDIDSRLGGVPYRIVKNLQIALSRAGASDVHGTRKWDLETVVRFICGQGSPEEELLDRCLRSMTRRASGTYEGSAFEFLTGARDDPEDRYAYGNPAATMRVAFIRYVVAYKHWGAA
jgi:hypothetical protein